MVQCVTEQRLSFNAALAGGVSRYVSDVAESLVTGVWRRTQLDTIFPGLHNSASSLLRLRRNMFVDEF
jgi:hypothetical protein